MSVEWAAFFEGIVMGFALGLGLGACWMLHVLEKKHDTWRQWNDDS